MLSNGQDSISSYYLTNTILYCKKIINNNSYLLYCYHLFQKNNIIAFWQLFKLKSTFKKPIIISLNHKNLKKRNTFKNNEINARLWRIYSKKRINNLFKYKKITFVQGHTYSDLIETVIIFFLRFKILRKIYLTKTINNSKKYNNNFSTNLINYPKNKITKTNLQYKKTIRNLFYMKEHSYINYKIYFKSFVKTYKIKRPLLLKKFKRKDISILIFKILLPFTYDISNKKVLYIRNKIRIYYIIILKNIIKNARNQI
uniref:tRNA(Ile) lysidine synthetase n=1 Tax=Prototheca zopfii TaxID=3112 RepID=A0A2P1G7P3_9CHLO|nr:tRNA(Ile) lysidine synthetase [Prototheca bovis]AVM80981.1 tRNA(Ile) lysidine synthetase [Prototheca bovis]